MENNKERKTIKITLKSFIFITIAVTIIIIGAAGLCINGLLKKDKSTDKDIEKQALVKDGLEVDEDKRDEIVEDNNYLDTQTAKIIIQSYLNIYGKKQFRPVTVLSTEEIGLVAENSEVPGGDYVDDENYRSSNIRYDDFKNKMLEYMTEEVLKELSIYGYKNVNGMLYVFDGGASGLAFDLQEIKKTSSNENSIEYQIKGILNSSGEEHNFTGEAILQKNENGKYVVSALVWTEGDTIELEEDNFYNKMIEMLKHKNKLYKANYYYRLARLINNNDGTYTATVEFYSPILISQEKYNNIVNEKGGIIENISYTFSNSDNEFNIGYGYIYNDNVTYTIEKQDSGYAFYSKRGGEIKVIDTIANCFEIVLNEDTVIQQTVTEGDFVLKDYVNILTDSFISSNMITFEYSEKSGEIYIFSEIR